VNAGVGLGPGAEREAGGSGALTGKPETARGVLARMIAKLPMAPLAALLAVTSADAQSPAQKPTQDPTPTGFWQDSSGRIQVEIGPCGELLCGKIVWFKWPNGAQGLPLVDLKNKDPALRGRPLLGLTILDGLHRTGGNTWDDGKIYNPEDGESYQADMSIADDGSLRVNAHAGPFGKTLTWTRMDAAGGQPSVPEKPPSHSGSRNSG
jgi:uncharacterized protein (DUF2147 family)